jgi:hypothetical protein
MVSQRAEVRPMRISIILALTAVSFIPAAQADFVVTSMPQAAQPPLATEEPANHPAPPPRLKTAYGFGDQVPLSFAVRQIVPSTIHVTYGRGADPNALVDWKGGQAWNRTLLNAVKPLRLRLVITGTAVEIRK